MFWYKKLYLGNTAINLTKRQIKSIQHGHFFDGVYLVLVSDREGELLEIYNAFKYPFKRLKKTKRTVVGIALGYDEALLLVKTIVDDVYKNTGDLDLKTYLTR